MLELSEELFNWVQIGGVFRQEQKLGACGADEPAYSFALVTAEIIDDHNVPGAKRGEEDFFDIDLKSLAVDRPLEKPWRLDAIVAQRSQERGCIPATVGGLGFESSTARPPSAQGRHVGLGPSLIDEDQALRVDPVLVLGPLCSSSRDVGTVAFASHHAFF